MKKEIAKFSEEAYYSGYKAIRNKFRRYTPHSVLIEGINYLYRPVAEEITQLQKAPWLVLLLIKWSFLDEESSLPGKRKITIRELEQLIQMVFELSDKARLPSQYAHLSLSLRNIAYQQFLYQINFNYGNFVRQTVFFYKTDPRSLIRMKFHELVGMDVKNFIELSIVLLARFHSRRYKHVSKSWFATLCPNCPDAEVTKFLDAISVSFDDLPKNLEESDQGKLSSSEYYEQTPFIRFPLIRIGDLYYCIYPNVLFRSLENFVYDRLRDWDSSRFMQKFGRIFEDYISDILKNSGLIFVDENYLINKLPKGSKVVDFVVSDGDSNIFIDAKAVEMAYQGKVAHDARILLDRTKTSVVKAIEQGYAVCSELSKLKLDRIQHGDTNYLVVVTLKELYLGNGKNFQDVTSSTQLDRLIEKFGSEIIPLKNIYFLTIDEFDLFLEGVRSEKITFASGLDRAIESDNSPHTKRFDFLLHLRSWKITEIPQHLKSLRDELIDSLANEAQKP